MNSRSLKNKKRNHAKTSKNKNDNSLLLFLRSLAPASLSLPMLFLSGQKHENAFIFLLVRSALLEFNENG
jgi:hypothetical protein